MGRFSRRRRGLNGAETANFGSADRSSYRAFLRAIRDQPGFGLRLLAFAFLLAGVFIRSGVIHGVVVAMVLVVVFMGPGYVAWRQWGRR